MAKKKKWALFIHHSMLDHVLAGRSHIKHGSSKKSHHHKHHVKTTNSTSEDLGKAKSVIIEKPKAALTTIVAKTKSTISKKQSLGMPLNNLDETGLGGEPVGHLDASEGVGGLGGDQDGVPIGMGAGAEPLGMSKGKEMSNGMEENGGAMQGLNEESENMHAGNEDVTRPFNEQEEGDFIEGGGGGGHGGNMMAGHSNNFMPSSGNSNGMSMMGPPNGGGMGNGMGNFMGNSNEGGNGGSYMGNGGGGGGDNGGNFMGQSSDEGGYRGPKKDPLGGDIKPFNDEFKNDDGGGHGHAMNSMGSHHGDSSHGGMSQFTSPMQEEGGEHMGGGGGGGGEHEFNNPSPDIGEALNGNLAALDKVNIQGDSDVGKSGSEGDAGASFMGQSSDDASYRGPKRDPLGGDIKPFNDEHKNDDEAHDGGRGGHAMSFMGHKHKGSSTEQEGGEHTGSQGGVSDFTNPSPADIGKALNGNLAALDSVNIQGDSDVAEMVRKATHQKEFTSNDSGTFNGISLMEPGFSSTTKHFFANGRAADRRTKGNLLKKVSLKGHKRRLLKNTTKQHKFKKFKGFKSLQHH